MVAWAVIQDQDLIRTGERLGTSNAFARDRSHPTHIKLEWVQIVSRLGSRIDLTVRNGGPKVVCTTLKLLRLN